MNLFVKLASEPAVYRKFKVMKAFPTLLPANAKTLSADHILASVICRKWVALLGQGFHPDTRGNDYSPTLSAKEAADYEAEMNILFATAADPYAVAIEAMEQETLK